MIPQDGRIIASWGDISHKVNVRSIRKSLISALYGIGVAEGRIRLDQTIGELGIDDRPPSLSEFERQATIRDLLMARSGIYHAAAYETQTPRQNARSAAVILPAATGITTIGTLIRSASSIKGSSAKTSFRRLSSELASRSAWRTSRQTMGSSFSSLRPIILLTHLD